jgi:hypothetical protein
MAQYAVLIYERETPGGVADIPPEVMEAHEHLPERVADGPFIETKEALAGVFVLEARDLDHAIALARLTPIVSGGVEVRPLIGFDILEAG